MKWLEMCESGQPTLEKPAPLVVNDTTFSTMLLAVRFSHKRKGLRPARDMTSPMTTSQNELCQPFTKDGFV